MAADLLLQYNPSQELLKSMLKELPDQKNKEVNTALLSRVGDLLDKGNRPLLTVRLSILALLFLNILYSQILIMILKCSFCRHTRM